jgi:arylsulfatase A-like enzyme
MGNRIPNISPDSALNVKKKIGDLLRNIRTKIKKQKINELNLSPYQHRVLMESRMEEGHRMFDDLVKVPLIFSGLNIPSNKEILQQVRHVDIFPTIEDVLSLPKKNNIDGESLLPLIDNKKIHENPAYIESPPAVKEEHVKKKIIGIRTSSYKMLKQADSGDVVELYDLVKDPLEEENIVSSHPELVKEMESKLEKIMSSKKITTTENKVDLTKIKSELEKLGYR